MLVPLSDDEALIFLNFSLVLRRGCTEFFGFPFVAGFLLGVQPPATIFGRAALFLFLSLSLSLPRFHRPILSASLHSALGNQRKLGLTG